MKQFLIAIDQTLNTLVWAQGEGFGKADETLSARAYRLRHRLTWGLLRRATDMVFFWDREGETGHCQLSYISEQMRKHLPAEYRVQLYDHR